MTTSRRSFLKQSALVTGGLAASTGLLANPSMLLPGNRGKEKLGVALVGFGYYSIMILHL